MEYLGYKANWAKEAIRFPQLCTIVSTNTGMYFKLVNMEVFGPVLKFCMNSWFRAYVVK